MPSTIRLLLMLVLLLPHPGRAAAAQVQDVSPNVMIRSPHGGEAVQGVVAIRGNANPAGLAAYEVSFGYSGDQTGTWFIVVEGVEAVSSGTLAEWDTFPITDGEYTLRLLVTLNDGAQLEHRVEGVRVRNYSMVETSTPAPPPTATQPPTPDLTAMFTPSASTATPAPPATVTPLPPNPAEVRPGDIPLSMARGGAGVLVAFILLGLYTTLRNMRRK